MNNAPTIPQAYKEEQDTVKTNIVFPGDVWRETKKAAIDAGLSAQQFVVDAMRARLGMPDQAVKPNPAHAAGAVRELARDATKKERRAS